MLHKGVHNTLKTRLSASTALFAEKRGDPCACSFLARADKRRHGCNRQKGSGLAHLLWVASALFVTAAIAVIGRTFANTRKTLQ